MKKPRKKRRRSKLPRLARFTCLITAIALIGASVYLDAASKNKERTQKERAAVAVIAGTVFQSSGRLLPGAKVQAISQTDRKTKSDTVTDVQGDFAIRVTGGPGTYVVTASAKGFQPQQKTVEVSEGEKVRTNLILTPVEPPAKN